MANVHFTAEILILGINPYVLVNKSAADALKKSWRRPMPVLVKVNDQPLKPWRINMMPVGNGDFYLYLAGTVRKASNTKVGDIVTVDISFDEAYTAGPEPLPSWFKLALENNHTAYANWNRLPPSRQKEVVRTLSRLKSVDAQTKNLDQIMHVLSGYTGRYIGRLWSNGS